MHQLFWRTVWEPWQDGVLGGGLWGRLLREGDLALKEGFDGAHEGVSEGPKVGAIAEFLGENISAVDVSGNMFDLDREFLLLGYAEKVFLEVDIFESFGCHCFVPVAACAVFVADDGGQGDVWNV